MRRYERKDRGSNGWAILRSEGETEEARSGRISVRFRRLALSL